MSTIKVDTYLTRGGASEIAIDKLKGASSASSISVVAEGGTTTTNLQQGLAKAWVFGGTNAALDDSFNISSGTDNGEGDYSYAINNDMSQTKYSVQTGVYNTDNRYAYYASSSLSASTIRLLVKDNDGTDDDTVRDSMQTTVIHGDLA